MDTVKSPFQLPGYMEAVRQERFIRAASVLRLTEDVNGFEVVPMTLRHYTILLLHLSPLLPPFTETTPGQLTDFLWLLNPKNQGEKKKTPTLSFRLMCKQFCPGSLPWRVFRTNRRMIRFMRHTTATIDKLSVTIAAARDYVEETMQDAPDFGEGNSAFEDYYSDPVSVCTSLARHHSYSFDFVMNMPLKVTFQCMREIAEKNANASGRPVMLTNPSSQIVHKYMKDRNRILKRN
jgi:hypothetical protein